MSISKSSRANSYRSPAPPAAANLRCFRFSGCLIHQTAGNYWIHDHLENLSVLRRTRIRNREIASHRSCSPMNQRGIDSQNSEAVMDLLRQLHADGATICMVTHDPRYARLAD